MFIGVRVNTELDQKLVYNSGFQTLPSKLLINILSLVVYLEWCTELAPTFRKAQWGRSRLNEYLHMESRNLVLSDVCFKEN